MLGLVSSKTPRLESIDDLRRRAEEAARYVDPSAWFCWKRSCPVLVGGMAVYVDDRHLSPAYSRHLSHVVRNAVLPSRSKA